MRSKREKQRMRRGVPVLKETPQVQKETPLVKEAPLPRVLTPDTALEEIKELLIYATNFIDGYKYLSPEIRKINVGMQNFLSKIGVPFP